MTLPRVRRCRAVVAVVLAGGLSGPPTPGEPMTLATVGDRATDGQRVMEQASN